MKLSTMFKAYRYASAFAGFGLPGLVVEAAKSSIKKEVAFQLATRTPNEKSMSVEEKHPELALFFFNNNAN